jgi:general secretion pathway protein G
MNKQPMGASVRRARGFSLLELLAVVTIMGIIAVVIVPRIGGHTNEAKKNACFQYRGDLNSAIERYRFDHGSSPASLNDLTPDYYPEAIPPCPYTNGAYTIDATTGRIAGHNH